MAEPLQSASSDEDFSHGNAGPWLLGRQLGGGGQGRVYLVKHSGTGQLGAAKVLRYSHGQASGLSVRFEREVTALEKLDHPNIVGILDAGESDADGSWMVMDYVTGPSLAEFAPRRCPRPEGSAGKGFPDWQRAPLPNRRIAVIVGTIARAMATAHGKGIVHRDLKVENVVMRDGTEPVIVDFGLALPPKTEGVTLTSFAIGTPVACAPEVLLGLDNSTLLSDIFSIGIMLYHLLTGEYPWGQNSNAAALRKVIDGKKGVPAPMRTWLEKVDPELEAICLKCLEFEPEKRFSSCIVLAEELDRWLAGLPTLTQPPGPFRRLWKWARRNPVPAGLLAAGVAFSGWQIIHLIRENNRLALAEAESARARQREAQRVVWEAFSARNRRDTEGQNRAVSRFRELLRDTPGWETVDGILSGLLQQEAIPAPGIISLAADAGGRRAAGGKDGVVRMFDAAGHLTHDLLPPPGTQGAVSGLAFLPEGRLLRAAERGGLHLISPDQPGLPCTLISASASGLVPAGDLVLATGPMRSRGDVLILDARTGELLRVLPDGGHAAAAGRDLLITANSLRCVTVWNRDGTSILQRWAAGGTVTALALCGDDRWAAWSEADSEAVYLRDLRQPEQPVLVLAGADSPVISLAAQGEELAAGCQSGTVLIWNPSLGSKPRRSTTAHAGAVTRLVWPEGRAAPVSAGADGMIREHPAGTTAEPRHEPPGWAAAALAAWVRHEGEVVFHTAGRLPVSYDLPDAPERKCLGTNASGSRLCTVRLDQSRVEWLEARGARLEAVHGFDMQIPEAEGPSHMVLESGKYLGILTPLSIRVLDAENGKVLWQRTLPEPQPRTSPQSRLQLDSSGTAASWSWNRDGQSMTWLVSQSGSASAPPNVSVTRAIEGHAGLFAAGTVDGACGILNGLTGKWQTPPVQMIDGPVRSVAIAADGHTMAVSGHLDRHGNHGGLTLVDLRQAGQKAAPSFVFEGQAIHSLSFTGTSLGYLAGGGAPQFAGPRGQETCAAALRGQPQPPQAAVSRIEWRIAPDALPALSSESTPSFLESQLRPGETASGKYAWTHTFTGLPASVKDAQLILKTAVRPTMTGSICQVRLGADLKEDRWFVRELRPSKVSGKGTLEAVLPLTPELIAACDGTLECTVVGGEPLQEMRLITVPDGPCAIPAGGRQTAEGLLLAGPVEWSPPADGPAAGWTLIRSLESPELWTSGGTEVLPESEGKFLLPAGKSDLVCTFDLSGELPGTQLALWIDMDARNPRSELNGIGIPRPDTAPIIGVRRLFVEASTPGLLRPGRNVLRVNIEAAQTEKPIRILGGVWSRPATAR